MKYLLHSKEYHNTLYKLVAASKEIKISTFGVYAGVLNHKILPFHDLYKTFELMRSKKVQILVGVADERLCFKGCRGCKLSHKKYLQRIERHIEHWPEIDWRLTTKHHAKMMIFDNKYAILGGRNLTGSGFEDLSFLTFADTELINYFDRLWQNETCKSL